MNSVDRRRFVNAGELIYPEALAIQSLQNLNDLPYLSTEKRLRCNFRENRYGGEIIPGSGFEADQIWLAHTFAF